MKILYGDLLEMADAGKIDVLVHGCNCFCTMGKGIAKQIRMLYPSAYLADCATRYGDRTKLGSYTTASVVRNAQILTIVNAYTQFDYRGEQPKVNYDAIRSAFRKIKQEFSGQRIGYPKIGAGLAGGDWGTIQKIIEEELAGEDHTLVLLYKTEGETNE